MPGITPSTWRAGWLASCAAPARPPNPCTHPTCVYARMKGISMVRKLRSGITRLQGGRQWTGAAAQQRKLGEGKLAQQVSWGCSKSAGAVRHTGGLSAHAHFKLQSRASPATRSLGVVAHGFDEGEHVVPAAAVEACREGAAGRFTPVQWDGVAAEPQAGRHETQTGTSLQAGDTH